AGRGHLPLADTDRSSAVLLAPGLGDDPQRTGGDGVERQPGITVAGACVIIVSAHLVPGLPVLVQVRQRPAAGRDHPGVRLVWTIPVPPDADLIGRHVELPVQLRPLGAHLVPGPQLWPGSTVASN